MEKNIIRVYAFFLFHCFIPIVIIAVAILIMVSILTGRNRKNLSGSHAQDRNSILKEANKRLASNPKDAQALTALAELHFAEQKLFTGHEDLRNTP